MNIPGREILCVEVGSTLHGIGIGDDDLDLMGVTIEPVEAVLGLQQFEQVEHRTAAKGQRSGPGDTDLVVYGLKKWMRLAIKGNPSVILLLYAPAPFIKNIDDTGVELRAIKDAIVSQRCKGRFLGYLNGQRRRAEQEMGSGRGRREGREAKWASHMVRLGYQGVELLSTGNLTLPMDEGVAGFCREVKRGDVPFEDALEVARDYEAAIESIIDSPLRVEPDLGAIQDWMRTVYLREYNGWRR